MTGPYCFGRFELLPATRELLVDGQPATVGGRAFDVLLALLERRERLVTKEELLDLAWPGLVVEENNLQTQISSLRKILGDGVIKTVPGHGYRFVAPSVPSAEIPPPARRHNLPQALTRFIGHDADLDQYQTIVVTSRLVTLTGSGGCGKTRLAVEVASRLLPKFADGVWFVDLAPMANPARLPATVARTLGLAERPDQSIVEKLCEYVAEQQMLLVLDNCEHLVDACAELVAMMLDRVSELHILATSREAMGLPGEQTLRVRSLTCPPPGQEDGSNGYARFEAVQLFVDRARLAQPDFTLDTTAAPAVGEICRRLDGIPLAIELAAARTKVRSVKELRTMLDDRFRLLVGGPRTAPPRQHTLRAAIKWSFDLLAADERRLLERLSIFAGSWTLEAAVAVASENAEQYAVLELLTHLVDKSLISSRSERDATRYSMLETVRQYGREALTTAGIEAVMAGRHLEYFVDLAERVEPAFGRSKSGALDQLAPELEDIVQALRGCERIPGGPILGLRLAAALGQYWMSLGLVELGYRLTTEALSLPGGDEPSRARARALFVATRLADFSGRDDEAWERRNECLLLARRLNDDHIAIGALSYLGSTAVRRGDVAQGIADSEEALRLARECADDEQISRALNNLGYTHYLARNFELAVPPLEECLQMAREQRDPNATGIVACNLADTHILRGETQSAWRFALEALDASSAANLRVCMSNVLDTVTRLAAAVGEWQTAVRLLGAADAAIDVVGSRRFDEEFWQHVVTSITNAFDRVDFQSAYDAGHALTIEQAIAEARAWLEKSGAAVKVGAAPVPAGNLAGR